MTAIFEMNISSETLSKDEIRDITGWSQTKEQVKWLDENGWQYYKNRSGDPVVGRFYARLRLAGINTTAITTGGWAPDFSAIG